MEMILQYTLLLLLVALLLVRVFFGPALKRRLLGTPADRDEDLALKPTPVRAPVFKHQNDV